MKNGNLLRRENELEPIIPNGGIIREEISAVPSGRIMCWMLLIPRKKAKAYLKSKMCIRSIPTASIWALSRVCA